MLVIGVVEATREHGELEYTLPIFVPGVMEFMVMNIKAGREIPADRPRVRATIIAASQGGYANDSCGRRGLGHARHPR